MSFKAAENLNILMFRAGETAQWVKGLLGKPND